MAGGDAEEVPVAGGINVAQLAGRRPAGGDADERLAVECGLGQICRGLARNHGAARIDGFGRGPSGLGLLPFIAGDRCAEMNPGQGLVRRWRLVVQEHLHAAMADLVARGGDEHEVHVGLHDGEAARHGEEAGDPGAALAAAGEPARGRRRDHDGLVGAAIEPRHHVAALDIGGVAPFDVDGDRRAVMPRLVQHSLRAGRDDDDRHGPRRIVLRHIVGVDILAGVVDGDDNRQRHARGRGLDGVAVGVGQIGRAVVRQSEPDDATAGIASVSGERCRQGERGLVLRRPPERQRRDCLVTECDTGLIEQVLLAEREGLELGLQPGARELVGDPVGGLAIGVGAETMDAERHVGLDIGVEIGAAEGILRRHGEIASGGDRCQCKERCGDPMSHDDQPVRIKGPNLKLAGIAVNVIA